MHPYESAFPGSYTQDTIATAGGRCVVDGKGSNYGAQVAAAGQLRVAAITRLANADWHVVEGLERMGVDVFAETAAKSTCLRLKYPSANVEERVIYVTAQPARFPLSKPTCCGLTPLSLAPSCGVRYPFRSSRT